MESLFVVSLLTEVIRLHVNDCTFPYVGELYLKNSQCNSQKFFFFALQVFHFPAFPH